MVSWRAILAVHGGPTSHQHCCDVSFLGISTDRLLSKAKSRNCLLEKNKHSLCTCVLQVPCGVFATFLFQTKTIFICNSVLKGRLKNQIRPFITKVYKQLHHRQSPVLCEGWRGPATLDTAGIWNSNLS